MSLQQLNEDDARALEQDNPSGAVVLNKVHAFLGRFVAYPCEHCHVAHALWVLHAHLMDFWDTTPRIAFLSAEPSSGKTRALEISELLVPRPVSAVNVSPAYLFRKVGAEDGRPTILFDEIDTVFGPKAKENEEIRGLLNAGHGRNGHAGRCVVHGKTVQTEEIPAYCAVALAGLGWLPDTIMSRSVIVRMRRRKPDEKVEPFRRRLHVREGDAVKRCIEVWALAQGKDFNSWPELPSDIQDRDADIWESLIAVADMAGGSWPARARRAAVALVAASKDAEPSLGVRLLTDTRTVFETADQLATSELLRRLNGLAEAPWNDLRGKPLDDRRLSGRFRQYGIKPKSIRIGETVVRGYKREDLANSWARYLPPVAAGSATSATPVPVAAVADVVDLSAARGEATKPCAQCNLDDGQQRKHGAVWLHRECVRFYERGR